MNISVLKDSHYMSTSGSASYTYTIQEKGLYFLAYSAQSQYVLQTQAHIDAIISINSSIVAYTVASNGAAGTNAYAWIVCTLNVGDSVRFYSTQAVVGSPYSHCCVVKLK